MNLTVKPVNAIKPQLTFLNDSDAVIDVEYPYFGGRERDGFPNNANGFGCYGSEGSG